MEQHNKTIQDLSLELSTLRKQEESATKENKMMTGDLIDMKTQLEKLVYDSKEANIIADSMKEQNSDLAGELEELRVCCWF